MEDKLDWMVLSQTPGIGVMGFWRLVEYFGTPSAVLRATRKELMRAQGMRESYLHGLGQSQEVRRVCLQQLEGLKKLGAECLTFENSNYPQLLKEIKDPPPVLYLVGNAALLNDCCVAIVGSRAATSYGQRTAFNLARRLAAKGVTIVSGLALGIDTMSHKGALEINGNSIGVLGCGIDVVYPRQNHNLFKQLRKDGLVLSEYPLGTAPEGFRFPARNRIIAGMSRGVLVVEAAKKSGSLITAQLALDEGREVYAVPGQVDSFKSEGTHWLLQQGAKLVQSETDILEDLGFFLTSDESESGFEEDASLAILDTNMLQLLHHIEAYALPRDELILKSGMDVPEFSESLLMLELEGFVEILPGDEIRRIER